MNKYLDSYYVITGLSADTKARVYLADDVLGGGLPYWAKNVSRARRFNTLKDIADFSGLDNAALRGVTDIHTMAIVVSSQLMNPIEFKEQ